MLVSVLTACIFEECVESVIVKCSPSKYACVGEACMYVCMCETCMGIWVSHIGVYGYKGEAYRGVWVRSVECVLLAFSQHV